MGLQTLEQWIQKNQFQLDTKTKYDELDKVYEQYDAIMKVAEKENLTWKDIRPLAGLGDLMQEAYVKAYEPSFPRYEVNKNFVGSWESKWTRYDSRGEVTN